MNVRIVDEMNGETIRTVTVSNESEMNKLALTLDVMQAVIIDE